MKEFLADVKQEYEVHKQSGRDCSQSVFGDKKENP